MNKYAIAIAYINNAIKNSNKHISFLEDQLDKCTDVDVSEHLKFCIELSKKDISNLADAIDILNEAMRP